MTNNAPTTNHRSARQFFGHWYLVIFWSLVLGHWSFVRADTLWVSSGGGAIQIKDAKITKIENGSIFFSTSSGSASREISKVQRMQIDNEPAFNTADEAAATGKWESAVDGYL